MKKLTLQQLSETCAKYGVEFVDEKYRSTTFRHNFKCLIHNKIYNTSLESILKRKALKCCLVEESDALKNKNDIDYIKQECLTKGFEFVDDEYVGLNHRHYFKCIQHNKVYKSSFSRIHRGKKLLCCNKPTSLSLKEESVKEKLEKRGFKLLDDYRGLKKPHLVKCIRHSKTELIPLAGLIGKNHKGMSCCGKSRFAIKTSDTSGRNWNREYTDLKKKIKEKYEFTCQVCSAKELTGKNCVAHHLQSYGSYPELKYVESNLVCLCENCHTTFHKTFGFSNNTKEQYEEFVLLVSKNQKHWKSPMKKVDLVK